jgi:hypothetical protein
LGIWDQAKSVSLLSETIVGESFRKSDIGVKVSHLLPPRTEVAGGDYRSLFVGSLVDVRTLLRLKEPRSDRQCVPGSFSYMAACFLTTFSRAQIISKLHFQSHPIGSVRLLPPLVAPAKKY